MPKITSTFFPRRDFQSIELAYTSLEESTFDIQSTQARRRRMTAPSKKRYSLLSRSPDQEASWLHEAHYRASGRYVLQPPKCDVFHAQGRTIYNASRRLRHVEQFQHELPPAPLSPPTLSHPRPLGRRRSLLDETVHQVEGGKSLRRQLSKALDAIPEAGAISTTESLEPSENEGDLLKAVVSVLETARDDPDVDDGAAVFKVSRASTPSLTWTYSTVEIKEGWYFPGTGFADKPLDLFQKQDTMDELFDMYINAGECL